MEEYGHLCGGDMTSPFFTPRDIIGIGVFKQIDRAAVCGDLSTLNVYNVGSIDPHSIIKVGMIEYFPM